MENEIKINFTPEEKVRLSHLNIRALEYRKAFVAFENLRNASQALTNLSHAAVSARQVMEAFSPIYDKSRAVPIIKKKKYLINEDNSVLYSRRQAIFWANSWVERRNKSRAGHRRFSLQLGGTKGNTLIHRRLT